LQTLYSSPSRSTTIALCFLIAALEGFDIQAFGVAAPRLVMELGLAASQQGWAASSAMIGLVAGASAGGVLSDRWGRKPTLVIAVLLFGLFSVATAFLHNYPVLICVRIATGLGLGAALPNLIAIATEISVPSRRTLTVTAMFCGMPAGGAIVALLARVAGANLDWHNLFLIGGVLPIILAPVLLLFLPETRVKDFKTPVSALAGALFGGARATASTLLLWVVFFMTLIVLYLLLNWLPTLVVAKGLSNSDGATASLVLNAAGAIGAIALGLLVDRFKFRWVLLRAGAALLSCEFEGVHIRFGCRCRPPGLYRGTVVGR